MQFICNFDLACFFFTITNRYLPTVEQFSRSDKRLATLFGTSRASSSSDNITLFLGSPLTVTKKKNTNKASTFNNHQNACSNAASRKICNFLSALVRYRKIVSTGNNGDNLERITLKEKCTHLFSRGDRMPQVFGDWEIV